MGCNRREVVDGIEEEPDYIFMGDPAKFLELLLGASGVFAPFWYYDTLGSFKDAIYCLKYAGIGLQLLNTMRRLVEEERERRIESNGRLRDIILSAEKTEDINDGDLTNAARNLAGGG